MKITLDINPSEAFLLRGALANIGRLDIQCVRLQLKLADAILDAPSDSPTLEPPPKHKFNINDVVQVYSHGGEYEFTAILKEKKKNDVWRVLDVHENKIKYVFEQEFRKMS